MITCGNIIRIYFYIITIYIGQILIFFVSAPGYFSAYILGEFFARDLKKYFIKDNGKLFSNKVGSFLLDKIFKDGRNLDIEKLLSIIEFK